MVRNSKRRAFTIVELVIVIAVIAILAAVMIPTFGGVIESANVSADKQILSTVNSQIAIYTGLGNKIETEADLWKALEGGFNGGSDMTEKFDPRSAKNGYHYWYNAAAQKVELLQYEVKNDVPSLVHNNTGKMMMVRADDSTNTSKVTFAESSPRSFYPGYYFLDTKCENSNDIAAFFDFVADMSNKTKEEYAGQIRILEDLADGRGANKELAKAVLARINATAILTNQGAFINVDIKEGNVYSPAEINFIYIPENVAAKENYYLNHQVQNVGDAAPGTTAITDLTKIAKVAGSVVEIPANVKVAEGSLNGFGAITIRTNVTDPANLGDIFSADSVSKDAVIVVNGGNYAIIGTEVKRLDADNKPTGDAVATLEYKNPVTDFVVVGKGNVLPDGANTGYVALDKIKNGITLAMTANSFVGVEKDADGKLVSAYATVTWSVNETETGVKIDPNTGVVDFDGLIENVTTVKFTATVKGATVNADGSIKNREDITRDYTITIVKLTGATVSFEGSENDSKPVTNGSTASGAFLINYEDNTTTAKFNKYTSFLFDDETKKCINFVYNDNLYFTAEEVEVLGLSVPTFTFAADTNDYFSIAENGDFKFDNAKITNENSGMKGKIEAFKVNVTVADKATKLTATVNVNINDNTTTPFKSALPTYKETSNYVYKVGKGSPIALNEFFAEKDGLTDLSDYKIFVYADKYTKEDKTTANTIQTNASKTEYYFYADPVLSYTNKPTLNTELDFKDLDKGIYHIVLLAPKPLEDGEIQIEGIQKADAITMITIDVVDGVNITDKSDVFAYTATTDETKTKGNYGQKEYTGNVILHDNIILTGESDSALIILKANAKLYGNYFKISAESFKDSDSVTDDVNTKDTRAPKVLPGSGYSLIAMTGENSEINDLILNGPVYPEIATSSSTNGYFMFGIAVLGNNCKINNSYLFGFMTPVRIQGENVDMTIDGTVLEGGTWANLWINKAKSVTLDDVTTKQDHKNGYLSGKAFGTQKKVLGMGIYIHDDMQGRTCNIIMKGDTKQYNWISQSTSDFGGNVALAKTLLFAKSGDSYTYDEFFHYAKDDTEKTTPYANAAIVYQAIEMTQVEYYGPSLGLLLGTAGFLESLKPENIAFKWRSAKELLQKYGYNPSEAKSPNITVDDTLLEGGIKYNPADKVETPVLTLQEAGSLKDLLPSSFQTILGFVGEDSVRTGVDIWAASTQHTGDPCKACPGYETEDGYVVNFNHVPDAFDEFNPVANYNE